MQDHRLFVRWEINWQAQIGLTGAQRPMNCLIKDISFKGLRVVLGCRLNKDTPLRVLVCLNNECMLNVEVWVVWHKTIADQNVYGFYFTQIPDSDKEKIYKFLRINFSALMNKMWWKESEEEEREEEMVDRRIFHRFPVNLPIRFLDVGGGIEGEAETRDISAKGIGILAKGALKPKSTVEMWLKVENEAEPVYSRGEVVWAQPEDANQCRVGISLEKANLVGLSHILRSQ